MVYQQQMKSYATRLSEIEEKLVLREATVALKESKNGIRKLILSLRKRKVPKKKPPMKPIIPNLKNW